MYRKTLYSLLLLISIIFYLIGLFQLYILVSSVQNNTVIILENLSSLKLSYRITSARIDKIDEYNFAILDLVLNITWPKKIDYKGPDIQIMYKGIVIANISINSYLNPVINKKVVIRINMSSTKPNDELILVITAYTEKLDFKFTQPLTNVSSLLSIFKIYISDLKIKPMGNVSVIEFNTKTNYPINATLKVVLRDEQSNILATKTFTNYNASSTKTYICSLTLDSEIINKTKYIEFYVDKILLSKYRIGE